MSVCVCVCVCAYMPSFPQVLKRGKPPSVYIEGHTQCRLSRFGQGVLHSRLALCCCCCCCFFLSPFHFLVCFLLAVGTAVQLEEWMWWTSLSLDSGEEKRVVVTRSALAYFIAISSREGCCFCFGPVPPGIMKEGAALAPTLGPQ